MSYSDPEKEISQTSRDKPKATIVNSFETPMIPEEADIERG